jgi:hypothetical protein
MSCKGIRFHASSMHADSSGPLESCCGKARHTLHTLKKPRGGAGSCFHTYLQRLELRRSVSKCQSIAGPISLKASPPTVMHYYCLKLGGQGTMLLELIISLVDFLMLFAK